MRLYLIRHAQSVNNANPTHLRVEDPAITELGKRQSDRLGEAAKRLGLTHLFTSPFRRTLETTDAIRKQTGLTPIVRSDLFELGGCYRGNSTATMQGRPGMNRREIEEAFPHAEIPGDIDETGWWKCRPIEAYEEAVVRAQNVLGDFGKLAAEAAHRIVLVMHADFKRILLEQFHDEEVMVPMNTSITTVEFTNSRPRLVDFNNADHLTPELHTW